MIIQNEVITPEIAKAMLDANIGNRKINKAQVEMLAGAMERGEWRLTHQGIAFYEDGTLADGQHRLQAIIESGVTASFMVARGLPKEEQSVMALDAGKLRTFKDACSISGKSVNNAWVVVAKGVEFGFKRRPKLTFKQQLDLVEKYRDALEFVFSVAGKPKARITISPLRAALVSFYIEGGSKAVIKEFCNTLYSGFYDKPVMRNAIKVRDKLLIQSHTAGGMQCKAFGMVKNALEKTESGVIIERLTYKAGE